MVNNTKHNCLISYWYKIFNGQINFQDCILLGNLLSDPECGPDWGLSLRAAALPSSWYFLLQLKLLQVSSTEPYWPYFHPWQQLITTNVNIQTLKKQKKKPLSTIAKRSLNILSICTISNLKCRPRFFYFIWKAAFQYSSFCENYAVLAK